MNDRPTNDRPISTDTDAALEAALRDLGGALAPMAAPGLAVAVRMRVEVLGPPSVGRPRWLDRLAPPARPLRRGLVLALAAVLVLAGIAAAIGFGLPGLRIVILGPGQTTSPSPAHGASPSAAIVSPGPSDRAGAPSPAPSSWPLESLGLGDPVDPADLDRAAGYPVLLPTLPELGEPLRAFVRGQPPRAQVTAAYGATPSMPATAGAPTADGTPVAIIVMEYPGSVDGGYLKKILQAGSAIEGVTVAGHPGFWITGQPHELLYVDPDGQVESDQVRLVGNVLAWNDGALTFRIEGAPDLETALRIAESMR